MIVTVTYAVLGDTATAVHEAVRVTFRAGRQRGATVREYDEHNTELRSTWYRSAWIITRTKEETTVSECVAVAPGCADCEAERLSDPEYHRLHHEPIRCGGCSALLDDHKGNDRMVTQLCAEGCCRQRCCPHCGDVWMSDGPVGCPSCSPISRWGRFTLAALDWWLELRRRSRAALKTHRRGASE